MGSRMGSWAEMGSKMGSKMGSRSKVVWSHVGSFDTKAAPNYVD
jgi:hypothetical protein